MTVEEIAVKLGFDGIKKHNEKYKGMTFTNAY